MAYTQAQFQSFMPGYEQPVSQINSEHGDEGYIEVRHADGSGTAFYDTTQYEAPRGDYQVYEDSQGGQWFAIHGDPSVERRPVYEDGKPVYEDGGVKSVNVETVHYRSTPTRYDSPSRRDTNDRRPPRRK